MYMPQIIEQTGRSKRSFDIVSKLYEQNAIMLFEEIDDDTSFKIITQLLYLDSLDTDDDIKLYINSPGGVVTAGLSIIDTMNSLRRKVQTIGIGQCASMGAMILCCGTGTRKSLKNTRIMFHSVSGGFIGNIHDHKINFEETNFLQKKLMTMISDKSKLSVSEVERMTERDKFLSADQCIIHGFLDEII